MHAIRLARPGDHDRSATVRNGPFPWEAPHAAPEDRAVGLELELIELVRRRDAIADPADPEVAALDLEVDRILGELARIEPTLVAAG